MGKYEKLEIIYFNGKPDGIKIINKCMSALSTYVIPRQLLSTSKEIEGIKNPGIYFLINEDSENNIAQIYIGQTRNGVERLDDHNQKKTFWNKAFMFLSDKKHFTLDMISGLEEYCIRKAYEAQRYTVENKVNPKYVIGPFDLQSIEDVYEEIKFVLASQGYSLDSAAEAKETGAVYHTTRNGIEAIGVYGETFDVLEGSEINIPKPCNLDKYNSLRNELLENKDITKEGDKYILHKNISFKTPSGASVFVLGGSTNGWREWKDNDSKTLDELFRK